MIDVLIAAIGILLLIPVAVVLSVIIMIDSPGSPIIGLKRVGRHGRIFLEWKFRSMVWDAESRVESIRHLNDLDGPCFKMRNDPRTTKIGRFLRRTSIDELPQLWNVLVGEMSLVGPRPLPVDEWHAQGTLGLAIAQVPPGITGLAQVVGRNSLTFDQLMGYSLYYVEHWSLWLDWLILLATPQAILADHFTRSNDWLAKTTPVEENHAGQDAS